MLAGKLQIPDGDAYFARVFAETGDRFQYPVLQAALRLTPRRRVAVDVGAHVGSWARQLRQRFEAVYAFEPHPINFACLKSNTQDINAFNCALGGARTECDMVQHGTNSGCWRVIHGAGVQVLPLDDFELEQVDLIKIDVEGFEGEVIYGATKTLHRCAPAVVFEDNGLGPKLYGEQWLDPKPLLTSLGYRMRARVEKDEVWTM